MRDLIRDIEAGRQAKIVGDGANPPVTEPVLEGVTLNAVNDYYYRMVVRGSSDMEVVLKPSTVTNTPVAEIYRTMLDGVTPKGAATTINLTNGVQTVTRLEPLTGEAYVVLHIQIQSGDVLTLAQAEYTTL